MISPTQFDTCRSMEMFATSHQISMWDDSFKPESSQNTDSSTVVEAEGKLDNRLEDALHEMLRPSTQFEQEANKPSDKVVRRLAQNREAARKSRLRKKAYIQQLESSRIKLAQIEQELELARQQGLYMGGHSGNSTLGQSVNSGIAAFEMEYGHWIEEQNRHVRELRAALQARVSEIELRMLVESGMRHYENLFRIKAIVAKADVFYLMSGMWKSSAERFFLWIGGFRPSGLIKILSPQLDPLTEQQVMAVCTLQQSSQQAEDALSQGLDKLQQTLAETIATDPLDASGVANYMGQMTQAMEKLDALENFVNQADHLRQQALQQMHRILTIRQAARALLALGDYLQRLRALSSVWAARPREPI
ncbi:transcription factor TGA4-like [Asparagus officinalis]|nr:transcription factor TGA4-like [Asparagus officinalis]XP_020257352.1 transcription factor TGA4-like [Asparagus officinalis]XP_020257353.1 transcription factor TGA4-like [Asparagus officinalis]XP_020257354.1 transcription factor TGA4-like [Asparagus officinalis]